MSAQPQPQVHAVERLIHAEPQAVFDVIADPFRHHQFDGSGMVKGSPHGPGRLAQGVRFTMGQKVGPFPYRSINDVVEFEEGRRIAWVTCSELAGRRVAGGQIWRYELTPMEGGTLVRETYDLTATPILATIQDRTGQTGRYREAMAATLDRLARLVESD